jgi:indole-3-glycerol phosphate synthase
MECAGYRDRSLGNAGPERMSVLEEIIVGVKEDLALRKIPREEILDQVAAAPRSLDAFSFLRQGDISVIAEIKRSSPSKGALAQISNPEVLAKIYQDNGASAVSVLTEGRRFAGSLDDLHAVRKAIALPILRKDFMVDEYQFLEARAHGADLVLLIVAALSPDQLGEFLVITHELGMKALVEVHTEDELDLAIGSTAEIIGVNSRNLKTLEVDSRVFANLLPKIPPHILKVAESGISSRADVQFAQNHGAQAVLIGEALVRGSDPGMTLRALMGQG